MTYVCVSTSDRSDCQSAPLPLALCRGVVCCLRGASEFISLFFRLRSASPFFLDKVVLSVHFHLPSTSVPWLSGVPRKRCAATSPFRRTIPSVMSIYYPKSREISGGKCLAHLRKEEAVPASMKRRCRKTAALASVRGYVGTDGNNKLFFLKRLSEVEV